MKRKIVVHNDLEFPAIIKPADEGGYFAYQKEKHIRKLLPVLKTLSKTI